METNLRPLSLGEILDRTAELYRENFILFAGIASRVCRRTAGAQPAADRNDGCC